METLFKYSGLMPINFFENPTIKLSVPEHLNDPFEYNTSENIITAIKNNILRLGTNEEEAERLSQQYLSSVHTLISQNGIISLTETPRNFLMWAHYAAQHNGICIGLKNNILEHITNDDDDDDISINPPVKINYDNLRYSSEQTFQSVANSYKHAVIKHLLTKSDEWMYEKEHRSIIPYKNATKIMIHDMDKIIPIIKLGNRQTLTSNNTATIGQWIEACLALGYISKTEQENIYQINNDKRSELPEIDGAIQILTNSPHISFLIDINKEMIESIYFGCRVDKQTIKEYFDNIHEGIKIFHMDVCKVRFELTPIRVTKNYFN